MPSRLDSRHPAALGVDHRRGGGQRRLRAGIGGIFLGSYLYFAIFDVADNVANNPDYDWLNTSKGVDWWRHVWQIVTAAVLVVIASAVTGRRKA